MNRCPNGHAPASPFLFNHPFSGYDSGAGGNGGHPHHFHRPPPHQCCGNHNNPNPGPPPIDERHRCDGGAPCGHRGYFGGSNPNLAACGNAAAGANSNNINNNNNTGHRHRGEMDHKPWCCKKGRTNKGGDQCRRKELPPDCARRGGVGGESRCHRPVNNGDNNINWPSLCPVHGFRPHAAKPDQHRKARRPSKSGHDNNHRHNNHNNNNHHHNQQHPPAGVAHKCKKSVDKAVTPKPFICEIPDCKCACHFNDPSVSTQNRLAKARNQTSHQHQKEAGTNRAQPEKSESTSTDNSRWKKHHPKH